MPQRLRSRTRPTRPHSPRSRLACTPDAETLAARAHSRPPWRGRGARTHHARASGRRLAARAARAALRIVLTRAAEDVFTPTAAESAWRRRRVDSVARAQPRRAPPSSTRARWPRRRAAPELCGAAREAEPSSSAPRGRSSPRTMRRASVRRPQRRARLPRARPRRAARSRARAADAADVAAGRRGPQTPRQSAVRRGIQGAAGAAAPRGVRVRGVLPAPSRCVRRPQGHRTAASPCACGVGLALQ